MLHGVSCLDQEDGCRTAPQVEGEDKETHKAVLQPARQASSATKTH